MDRLRRYLTGWRRVDPDRLSVTGDARRTNNDAESFMATFGRLFPTAHPTWRMFVEKANAVSAILNVVMLQWGSTDFQALRIEDTTLVYVPEFGGYRGGGEIPITKYTALFNIKN